jgi:uncharacterized circularly permuted ATP-grasp superfamily protein/uncharacterized alpha-E superfamily protein
MRVQGPAEAPAASAFCAGYRPVPGVRDEMCAGPGELRAPWRYLVRALETLGPQERERRWQETRRLIRDNGVTYTVYGDPHGQARPWVLDLIPLLIPSGEWARIETGLAQRAELLNALLADLYGPREALRRGWLPPEVVLSHPGYLRACAGVPVPGPRHLMFYATDLGRSADGSIRVLGDRAQAPSGAGYALENRVVLSRVLPSVFRDSQVHRLAPFFRAMRRALAALAPAREEAPRVVVLTPGPRNEAYFEHAYLAGHLGYTLAQGPDLTVRGEGVYLWTLDGLQPVDVVLRRVDDDYCDPLELRDDSLLGVPGLLQAARAGRVAVVNPLGSGVLDNPALLEYLPGLARHLLGEELLLPNAETWWCGTPGGLSHVLANLGRLVVKPVRPGRGVRSVFGATLGGRERKELAEAIRARPRDYVGQAPVSLSTAPVLARDRLDPRHVVLRAFLVAAEKGYAVMPGGLTRAAGQPGQLVVSNQLGAIGKDTWVLASEPERQEPLLAGSEARRVVAGTGSGLPGRVADDLFWLGRYAERAEGLARLLRVVGGLVTDQARAGSEGGCPPDLLRAVTHRSGSYPGFAGGDAGSRLAEPESELLAVATDPGRVGGLAQSLQAMIAVSRAVRDRISSDTWRVVGELERAAEGLAGGEPGLSAALDGLEVVVGGLAAFAGLTAENMSRDLAWRFLELGRRLERAIHTAILLRSTLVVAPPGEGDAVLLEAVLEVTDSRVAYRQRFGGRPMAGPLLALLLHDEDNPRALAFQLARVHRMVAGLPRAASPGERSAEERLALEALSAVRLGDPRLLGETAAETASRDRLDRLLGRLLGVLPELSDRVSAGYFRHEEQPHPLVRLGASS